MIECSFVLTSSRARLAGISSLDEERDDDVTCKRKSERFSSPRKWIFRKTCSTTHRQLRKCTKAKSLGFFGGEEEKNRFDSLLLCLPMKNSVDFLLSQLQHGYDYDVQAIAKKKNCSDVHSGHLNNILLHRALTVLSYTTLELWAMHRWALNNLLRFFSGTSHSFTVFTIYSCKFNNESPTLEELTRYHEKLSILSADSQNTLGTIYRIFYFFTGNSWETFLFFTTEKFSSHNFHTPLTISLI